MTDRYDRAVRAMRDAPAPDQWDEILPRATTAASSDHDPRAGSGSGNSNGNADHNKPRRWPLLVGITAMVVVLGGAVVLLTHGDRSTTTIPGGAGEATDLPTTTGPSHSSGTPSTTTAGQTTIGQGATDVPRGQAPPCDDIGLSTTSPPEGMDGIQQHPVASDPRLPPEARRSVTGVFHGEGTQSAVLVLAGWQDVGFSGGLASVPAPFPEASQTWIGTFGDGTVAYFEVTPPDRAACSVTVAGVGISESSFMEFFEGLTLAP